MYLVDKYFTDWRSYCNDSENFINRLRDALNYFVDTHEKEFEEDDDFVPECFEELLYDYEYPDRGPFSYTNCPEVSCGGCDVCLLNVYNIHTVDETIEMFWDSKYKRLKTVRGNVIQQRDYYDKV